MREVKIKVVDVRNPTHRVEKKLEEIDETEYGNVTSSEKESQRQLGSHTTLEDDEPLAGEEVEIERTEGEEVKVPETLSRTTSMDGGKGPDESIYLNDGTLKGVLGDVFDVWGSKDEEPEKIDDEETIENLQKKLDVLKAPPIDNPRTERLYPNDNLTDLLIERLFEEIIDPKIISAEGRREGSVLINLNDLKMSSDFALEKVKQFYGDRGYGRIMVTEKYIHISLTPDE